MDEAIDDATVEGYEHRIDDAHAAGRRRSACAGGGNSLRRNRHRHRQSARLSQRLLSLHGIEAQHPDAFILELFKAFPHEVVSALNRLRCALESADDTRLASRGDVAPRPARKHRRARRIRRRVIDAEALRQAARRPPISPDASARLRRNGMPVSITSLQSRAAGRQRPRQVQGAHGSQRHLAGDYPQPSTYRENAKACRAASSIWASSALSLRSRQTLMSLPTPPPILTKGSMTTAPL